MRVDGRWGCLEVRFGRQVPHYSPGAYLRGMLMECQEISRGCGEGNGGLIRLSSYLWVAHCSPIEATEVTTALELKTIPTMVKMDGPVSMMGEHEAVRDYRGIFEGGIEGVEFYLGDQGMIGGYSAGEQRFRLFWWPEIRKDNNG